MENFQQAPQGPEFDAEKKPDYQYKYVNNDGTVSFFETEEDLKDYREEQADRDTK